MDRSATTGICRAGVFIASDAVSPDMVEELRQAARRVKARVRAGELDLYTDYRGEGQPYHVF